MGYLDADCLRPDRRIAACFIRQSSLYEVRPRVASPIGGMRHNGTYPAEMAPSAKYRKFIDLRESQCGPSALALRDGSW